MDDRKTQVCPQKQPFLRMDGRKSKVCPQKQPYMRMDTTNFDGCHKKEPGASAYKKASGSLYWQQLESKASKLEVVAAN